jgi:2-polyprenyl-3-methyl-5-hydroxy-6-metoxy-1,4-benzoquinol methylase
VINSRDTKENEGDSGSNLEQGIYRNYLRWRTEKATPTLAKHALQHNAVLFSKEVQRTNTLPGARIFEIGFGPGHFLDWARSRGFFVSGCEIVSDYVDDSYRKGHKVYLGRGTKVLAELQETFDLFVMFDVLEHMDLNEISRLFREIQKKLKRNGKVLVRFPNGNSPFSRPLQYGDATHKEVLTAAKLTQVVRPLGFEIVAEKNSARDWKIRSLNGLLKPLSFLARDTFSALLSLMYLGKVVPLDVNLTVIFKQSLEHDEQ